MQIELPFLQPGDAFPDLSTAKDHASHAPGLLAAGGDLTIETLCRAYSIGVFPWNNEWQPILWWSPDPRMVLRVSDFRLRRSFKKVLKRFIASENCEVTFDTAFADVIRGCAYTERDGQSGTWLTEDMIDAYGRMHAAGHSHSVETWVNGELVGGLYLTCIGRAVYGESMFSTRTDASKIALAALVCFCHMQGVQWIDCQQQTAHLHSLGAKEVSRKAFSLWVSNATQKPSLTWAMPSDAQWLAFVNDFDKQAV